MALSSSDWGTSDTGQGLPTTPLPTPPPSSGGAGGWADFDMDSVLGGTGEQQPATPPSQPPQASAASWADFDMDAVLQGQSQGAFNPEGAGYDYQTAQASGITPDATGHWPSRDPGTGQILKGQQHPTYHKTVEGEQQAGFGINKGPDGRYYSEPTQQERPKPDLFTELFPKEPPKKPHKIAGIPTMKNIMEVMDLDIELRETVNRADRVVKATSQSRWEEEPTAPIEWHRLKQMRPARQKRAVRQMWGETQIAAEMMDLLDQDADFDQVAGSLKNYDTFRALPDAEIAGRLQAEGLDQKTLKKDRERLMDIFYSQDTEALMGLIGDEQLRGDPTYQRRKNLLARVGLDSSAAAELGIGDDEVEYLGMSDAHKYRQDVVLPRMEQFRQMATKAHAAGQELPQLEGHAAFVYWRDMMIEENGEWDAVQAAIDADSSVQEVIRRDPTVPRGQPADPGERPTRELDEAELSLSRNESERRLIEDAITEWQESDKEQSLFELLKSPRFFAYNAPGTAGLALTIGDATRVAAAMYRMNTYYKGYDDPRAKRTQMYSDFILMQNAAAKAALDEAQERNRTKPAEWAGNVYKMIDYLSFFGMTGAAAETVETGAKAAIKKAIKNITKGSADDVISKFIAYGGGKTMGALSRLVVNPLPLIDQTMKRTMPREYKMIEPGKMEIIEPGDSVGMALLKSVGTLVPEYVSESVGDDVMGLVGKGAGKLIGKLPDPTQKALARLTRFAAKKYATKNNVGLADAYKAFKKATAWNGFVGEWVEEDINGAFMAMTGIEDPGELPIGHPEGRTRFEQAYDSILPGMREGGLKGWTEGLGMRASVLLVPGAGQYIAGKAAQVSAAARAADMELDEESLGKAYDELVDMISLQIQAGTIGPEFADVLSGEVSAEDALKRKDKATAFEQERHRLAREDLGAAIDTAAEKAEAMEAEVETPETLGAYNNLIERLGILSRTKATGDVTMQKARRIADRLLKEIGQESDEAERRLGLHDIEFQGTKMGVMPPKRVGPEVRAAALPEDVREEVAKTGKILRSVDVKQAKDEVQVRREIHEQNPEHPEAMAPDVADAMDEAIDLMEEKGAEGTIHFTEHPYRMNPDGDINAIKRDYSPEEELATVQDSGMTLEEEIDAYYEYIQATARGEDPELPPAFFDPPAFHKLQTEEDGTRRSHIILTPGIDADIPIHETVHALQRQEKLEAREPAAGEDAARSEEAQAQEAEAARGAGQLQDFLARYKRREAPAIEPPPKRDVGKDIRREQQEIARDRRRTARPEVPESVDADRFPDANAPEALTYLAQQLGIAEDAVAKIRKSDRQRMLEDPAAVQEESSRRLAAMREARGLPPAFAVRRQLRPTEQTFFDQIREDVGNQEELMEAAPSLKIEDGVLTVEPEDVAGLDEFVDQTVVRQERGDPRLPPTFYNLAFRRDLAKKAAQEQEGREGVPQIKRPLVRRTPDERILDLREKYQDPSIAVNPENNIASPYDGPNGEQVKKDIDDWAQPMGNIQFYVTRRGTKETEWKFPYKSVVGRAVNGRLGKETDRLMALGIDLPMEAVEVPGDKGKVTTRDVVYPADAMNAIADWVKTPGFAEIVDPEADLKALAIARGLKGDQRSDFMRLARRIQDMYTAVDKTPTRKKDIKIVGDNGKAGGHIAYGLITCHPSSGCALCYAAGDRYVAVLDKGVANAVVTMAKPEAFGRRVAEETILKDPKKKDMPFLRLLGSGDMTTQQQVDAFNAISANLDRPIHIFSRHHDLLDQLKSSTDAPFVKMGSVDKQLFDFYGAEELLRRKEDNGTLVAYLMTTEEDIPNIKALSDNGSLALVLTANETLYDQLREEVPAAAGAACPCDAGLRPFNFSCVQCALSRLGCFMHANDLSADTEGNTWVTTDPQAPTDTVPLMQMPVGKDLADTWIHTAARLVDQSIKNVKASVSKRYKEVRKGLGTAKWNALSPEEREAAAQAWAKKKGKTLPNIILKDLRFPGEVTSTEDYQAAQAYIEALANLKATVTDTKTFVVPGVDTIPTVAYRNGKRVADPAAERMVKAGERRTRKMIEPQFSVRREAPPAKTVTAYKLFRVKNGRLYPMFADVAKDVPIGIWLNADIGKTKMAPRPGWHAADLPVARHIGKKGPDGVIDRQHPNTVWAEVSMAADKDWQTEANNRARRNKQGAIIPKTAEIRDEIPSDGHYRYKTSPNMEGEWLVGGAIKVNRILADDEVETILQEAGVAVMPRDGGPADLKAMGLIEPQFAARREPTPAFTEARETFLDQVSRGLPRKVRIKVGPDKLTARRRAASVISQIADWETLQNPRAVADVRDNLVAVFGEGRRSKQFEAMMAEVEKDKTEPEAPEFAARRQAVTPEQDADYMAAAEAGDIGAAQQLVDQAAETAGAYWHGTPSGDLRGGVTGLHVGTQRAATEALEARIGIPADGLGWKGDREYGKTLLAGKDSIRSGRFGPYRETGYNVDAPAEDFFPTSRNPPVVGDNQQVDFAWKPYVRPVLIVGSMSNRPQTPMSDSRANATMKGLLRRGIAKRGYFYVNQGEDSGSVSAVLPNGEGVRVKLPDAVTRDNEGNVIPLSQRFQPTEEDIRFAARRQAPPSDKLGFYSPAARAVSQMPQDRMGAAQFKAWVQKQPGVKKAELDWMDLDAFLKGKMKIDRADLEQWAAENSVVLEEKQLLGDDEFVTDLALSYDLEPFGEGEWGVDWQEAGSDPLMDVLDHDPQEIRADYPESGFTPHDVRDLRKAQEAAEEATADWTAMGIDPERGHRAGENLEDVTREILQRIRQKPIAKARTPRGTLQIRPVADGYELTLDDSMQGVFPTIQEAQEEGYNLGPFESSDLGDAATYADYTLPGGSNYREVLLTMPSRETAAERRAEQALDILNDPTRNLMPDERRELERDIEAVKDIPRRDFRGGHFDEPNIVAHARITDRITPDGKRMLFVEEIQSDWVLEARKKRKAEIKRLAKAEGITEKEAAKRVPQDFGFAEGLTPEEQREDDALAVERNNLINLQEFRQGDATTTERMVEIGRRLDELSAKATGVPDMPFKRNWHELMMKRILAKAVAEGYDSVGWITGQQTAARYKLSKQVTSISWAPSQPEGAKQLVVNLKDRGVEELIDVDKAGKVWQTSGTLTDAQDKHLSDVIGKDLSAKILAEPIGVVSGLDLDVGGEWAVNLYDKSIPSFLKKYSKKWGAKVGESMLGTGAEEESPDVWYPTNEHGVMIGVTAYSTKAEAEASGEQAKVHSLPITDAMRESVAEGQPQFAARRRTPGAEPREIPTEGPFDPEIPRHAQQIARKMPETREGITALDLSIDHLPNEEAIAQAQARLSEDREGVLRDIRNPEAASDPIVFTAAQMMIKEAVEAGRIDEALMIAEDFVPQTTKAAQALQTLTLTSQLGPEGMLLKGVRTLNDVKKKGRKKHGAKWLKKHGPELELTPEEANQIVEFMKAAKEAKAAGDGRGHDLNVMRAQAVIANKVPASLWQKVALIQTMAQLLNLKTIGRNLVGNAMFANVDNVSKSLAVPLDYLASLKTGRRTTAMPSVRQQFKGYERGFMEAVEEIELGVSSRGMDTKYTLPQTQVFKGKFMGAIEKSLKVALGATDKASFTAEFDDSLRRQMKAAKATEPTAGMIEEATYDGLYITFQDDSTLAKFFSGYKKLLNAGQDFGLGDFIMKYPKTPGNLMQRGIDYSPAGLVKGMYDMGRVLINQPDNQYRSVLALSRGAVGTGIWVIGFMLAKLGIVTGAGERDRDIEALERQMGRGRYRVNTTAYKRWLLSGMNEKAAKPQEGDVYMTYDWAQPLAVPFAGAATLGEATVRGRLTQGDVLGMTKFVVDESTRALTQQPLMRGLRTWREGDSVIDALMNVAMDAPSSFIPTIIGQIAMYTDPVLKNPKDRKKSKEMLKRMAKKMPGLNQFVPDRVATTGEKVTIDNPTFFNMFINPAITTTYKPSIGTDLVLDLFDRGMGEVTTQFPRRAPKSLTIDGVTLLLETEEQNRIQEMMGTDVMDKLNRLAARQAPWNKPPEDVAQWISNKILNPALKKAKIKFVRGLGGLTSFRKLAAERDPKLKAQLEERQNEEVP